MNEKQKLGAGNFFDGHTTINQTRQRVETKDRTAYNIKDYRKMCRTCKDIGVEELEQTTTKKTYKRDVLLKVPNTGFSKRQNTTLFSTLKPKASIDKGKAMEKLNQAKGKIAP